MNNIILVNKEDLFETIEEEKSIWVFEVLVALGIEEDKLANLSDWDLKIFLAQNEIEIWGKPKGEVDILRSDKLVAQWKEPKFVVKSDEEGKFYEVKLNHWALPFQVKKKLV